MARSKEGSSDKRPSSTQPSDGQAPWAAVPQLDLPQGGGALRSIGEKFQANPLTGTASFSVPIAVSPGRGGFQPKLALSYNSGSGNGPFGLGWSIGRASITRKTSKGLPRYRDAEHSDTFTLTGAEDLVAVLADDGQPLVVDDPEYTTHRGNSYTVFRYRPRVEAAFARIERWVRRSDGDTHWRTITGDNRTTIFGESAQARVADPQDPSRVFEWLAERSFDDKGHVIVYEYVHEDGVGVDASLPQERHRIEQGFAQTYLKRVLYGNTVPYRVHQGHPDAPPFDEARWGEQNRWHFELVFDYGGHDDAAPGPTAASAWPVRVDPFSNWRAGFEVRTYRLCRRVLMFHRFPDELGEDAVLVRSTEFDYRDDPVATQLVGVRHTGYLNGDAASMPPVRFTYSEAVVGDTLQAAAPGELASIPDGETVRFVDLDGEGLQGLLHQHDGGWYFQNNLGAGHFGAPAAVAAAPALATATRRHRLADVDGDGRLEVVALTDQQKGFYARDEADRWQGLVAFERLPNIDWSDPNLRQVDLTGDGRPDLLITEHECLCWYASQSRRGWGGRHEVAKVLDEERGPAVAFADATQSIHLADMSGDGLKDIVRVRDGEVCYWPNMGYGHFGPKITMDRPPAFEPDGAFNPRRVRLADVDGSGTTDLVYLGQEVVRFWLNQSGNSFAAAQRIDIFPDVDNLASVQVTDLLGTGTGCLVWTSPLPDDRDGPIRYVELMSQGKPYLLEQVDNGMGAVTRVQYAPSTTFYLADRRAGRPWVTKLPFPVQVVERVETFDAIGDNRYVTHYAYHHGHYDGVEREFRGFGLVESWDAEQYAQFGEDDRFEVGSNHLDEASHIPPVHTKTWFHTGSYTSRHPIARQFAGEYYKGDPDAWTMPATELPAGLDPDEQRQACRALKGKMLRREVYALDGSPAAAHPYQTVEKGYAIRLEQPRGDQRYAVFFVHGSEALTYHYEREPSDPRIAHKFNLEVDAYGKVRRAASVVYPRRGSGFDEQQRMVVTCAETDFIHLDDAAQYYRVGLPDEQRAYEVRGLDFGGRWNPRELNARIDAAAEADYVAAAPEGSDTDKRLMSRSRVRYYRNSLDREDLCPFGEAESLALAYQKYDLAFTADILAQDELEGRIGDELLAEGGWRNDIDADPGHWWKPSGVRLFDDDRSERPWERFYLPVGVEDPFGATSTIAYDDYHLLAQRTEDALGNVTTTRNDYRILKPWEVTGPNGNRSRAAFDARGMVVATAAVGKNGEGDTLADPTTRFEYDLFAYERTRHTDEPKPNWAHGWARETHGDPDTRWQETRTYSDGFGRAILTKKQAEDGQAPVYDADGNLALDADGQPVRDDCDDRWVGTGATVFNNKGKPVRQYEPFFDRGSGYTEEDALVRIGVSPTLHYDPLGRVIRTDHPDGSFARVEFDPWHKRSFDRNDTVLEPGNAWYSTHVGSSSTAAERDAAAKAAAHHDTPSVAHLDVLGRAFVSLAHNIKDGADEFIPSRTELNLEGKPVAIYDGRGCDGLDVERAAAFRGNTVMRYVYAMGGMQLYQDSMDAGRRWALSDVAGKTIHTWDDRGHHGHSHYDALRRPTRIDVDVPASERLAAEASAPETMTVERIVYGESLPDDEARRLNLRGQAYLHFDGAGLVANHAYDFKGNLLRGSRRLAVEFRGRPDWSALDDSSPAAMAATDLLEEEVFSTETAYDALDRPIRTTTPDDSVHTPHFNKAGLLERVEVRLNGADGATAFVDGVDYDARGRRTDVFYSNGVRTTYTYDDMTLRLVRIHSRQGGRQLQDLEYTYDPVGNITEARDNAIAPVYFDNATIEARSQYAYDALYRLTAASGRESAATLRMPSEAEIARVNEIPAHDGALRTYTQSYAYDPVGNIVKMVHHANGTRVWVRDYSYAEGNNRLESNSRTGAPDAHYTYDAHGNMQGLPHLASMDWDHKDQLLRTEHDNGEEVFYNYDSSRQRARKVRVVGGVREERIYLGGTEIYRRSRVSDASLRQETRTLHIMDGDTRICLVDTPTVRDGRELTRLQPRFYYQLSNHLGSSTVELDEHARVLTYEEYHPYGTTAFHSRNTTDVRPKRYRYTGMERDSETGLNYHTARYYMPWLGRWCSADPAGLVDGVNLYEYAHDHPVVFRDVSGLQGSSRVDSTGSMDAGVRHPARGSTTQTSPPPAGMCSAQSTSWCDAPAADPNGTEPTGGTARDPTSAQPEPTGRTPRETTSSQRDDGHEPQGFHQTVTTQVFATFRARRDRHGRPQPVGTTYVHFVQTVTLEAEGSTFTVVRDFRVAIRTGFDDQTQQPYIGRVSEGRITLTGTLRRREAVMHGGLVDGPHRSSRTVDVDLDATADHRLARLTDDQKDLLRDVAMEIVRRSPVLAATDDAESYIEEVSDAVLAVAKTAASGAAKPFAAALSSIAGDELQRHLQLDPEARAVAIEPAEETEGDVTEERAQQIMRDYYRSTGHVPFFWSPNSAAE